MELDGEKWVLVQGGDMLLDMDKKPMVFDTEHEARMFKRQYGTLAEFEPIQVKNLVRH